MPGHGNVLAANLPQLQNLIKRDPVSYKEEFMQQWNHFNSIRLIFKINPDEQAEHFRELVGFMAQVATCYPNETAEFPSHISTLLLENYGVLSPDTRKTLVQNLVMLRNKNVITSIELLRVLFPLLPRTTSAHLRSFIRGVILSDLRNANSRTKNHKLNKAVQGMLFTMVEHDADGEVIGDRGKKAQFSASTTDRAANNGEAAMWAVILTKELWKRSIWADPKSVAIIARGCFHPITKVQSASIHFFLSTGEDVEEPDEDEEIDVRALHHRREINKKTRSADKKLRKKLKVAKKKIHAKAPPIANFPALELLHDPQTFAEKLFDNLNAYDKRFTLDHKILLMQLIARVMGSHKLCVLGFYTYIVKYLVHRQLRVPSILAALAQSVHNLTPPDAIAPVIRKLAQEFVHPGVASEVIAAGLNSIREVCRRQPWAMEEDLLGDLIEYRKSKDKAVTAAARGLLGLYREVNPGLLKKRERGKEATMGLSSGNQPLPYGHTEAPMDIDGLALLEDHLRTVREEAGDDKPDGEDDDAAWQGWEIESESSDDSDSESWIDVPDGASADLVISDSDDEKEHGDNPNDTTTADPPPPTSASTLATTKILTPADFALLRDLRLKAAERAVETGGGPAAKRKLAALQEAAKSAHHGGANNKHVQQEASQLISENDILGPRKKAKADYAERLASVRKGREGREKFGSSKGKQGKKVASSSTNREKARNKPIMMILASGGVRGKKKASLREKQQRLRRHVEEGKKHR